MVGELFWFLMGFTVILGEHPVLLMFLIFLHESLLSYKNTYSEVITGFSCLGLRAVDTNQLHFQVMCNSTSEFNS